MVIDVVYSFSGEKVSSASRTLVVLSAKQFKALARSHSACNVPPSALFPIVLLCRIHGGSFARYFNIAGHGGVAVAYHRGVSFMESPVAVLCKVALSDPFRGLVRMASFGPRPKLLPYLMVYFFERYF